MGEGFLSDLQSCVVKGCTPFTSKDLLDFHVEGVIESGERVERI